MAQQTRGLFGRRNFLRRGLHGAAGLSLIYAAAGCGRSSAALVPAESGAPEPVPSVVTLSEWGERGAPLVVRGRVFASDGRTRVEGATLYVYHTDARGLYSETHGDGREPQPRIKGRVRTDRDGAYEFRTTRPAAYPGGTNPQHIHAQLSAPGRPDRWIDDFWFEDDPLVTAAMRERHKGAGAFSPILRLTRDASGVFRAARDIRLG